MYSVIYSEKYALYLDKFNHVFEVFQGLFFTFLSEQEDVLGMRLRKKLTYDSQLRQIPIDFSFLFLKNWFWKKDYFFKNDNVTPDWILQNEEKFENIENSLTYLLCKTHWYMLDKFCEKLQNFMRSWIVVLY